MNTIRQHILCEAPHRWCRQRRPVARLCGSHRTCVGQLSATVPQTLSNVLNKLFCVPLSSGLKEIIAFAAGTADKSRSAVVSLRVRGLQCVASKAHIAALADRTVMQEKTNTGPRPHQGPFECERCCATARSQCSFQSIICKQLDEHGHLLCIRSVLLLLSTLCCVCFWEHQFDSVCTGIGCLSTCAFEINLCVIYSCTFLRSWRGL